MKRHEKISKIRDSLSKNLVCLGGWVQIPDSSYVEIMGRARYDWIAVDMEHGSIDPSQLPNLFRAIEVEDTLPLVRLAQGSEKDCKQALDAGAGGVIIPNIKSANELSQFIQLCCWPPRGKRGVGFSRANNFGGDFSSYSVESQKPLIVAMIESQEAVNNLDEITKVNGLDAIFVGPYDLSASMGIPGEADNPKFISTLARIVEICRANRMHYGIHVVEPSVSDLNKKIVDGYTFIAYSLDSALFRNAVVKPIYN